LTELDISLFYGRKNGAQSGTFLPFGQEFILQYPVINFFNLYSENAYCDEANQGGQLRVRIRKGDIQGRIVKGCRWNSDQRNLIIGKIDGNCFGTTVI